MKRFIRLVCFVLVAVMVTAIPARAAEGISPYASNYFGSSNVYLYETSANSFQVWFHVAAVRIMEKIGAKEIKVQRSSDTENWTTVRTYKMEEISSMVYENSAAHTSHVNFAGSNGYYYRAYIKLYAKDSAGSATWGVYTSYIYLD